MTARTCETYRRKLLALRDRLSHAVADLEVEPTFAAPAPASAESEPGDPGDASVNLYEDLVNRALLENETGLLRDVHDALERLEEGDFGTCETCGSAIAAARLDALPYSRSCAGCAPRA